MTETKAQTIAVTAQSQYLAEQSQPDENRFVFSYTITISNNGSEPTQLISRHWIITDESGQQQEVKGKGVIGQQPVIGPGEEYSYSSGAILNTPTGTMTGSYQMKSEDESVFDAPIPIFALLPPGRLH